MVTTLGLPERAALVILAATGGRLSAVVLRKAHGITLKKPQRERLIAQKLLREAKAGRTIALELTDDGWAYLENGVANDPPVSSGSGGKALFLLLATLGQRGRSLRDLLAGDPPPPPLPSPPPPPPESVEDRIERGYRALSKRPRDWVELKALRHALPDVDRGELDAALKLMRREKRLTMTLEENQSRLGRDDREAALRIGPDDMHYLSME